ncbi:MAG TPA: hypothetical protein PLN52_11350 [Opitutaceae bacterium]|nr:hypothetical protein [Opitutaceae bacterium]
MRFLRILVAALIGACILAAAVVATLVLAVFALISGRRPRVVRFPGKSTPFARPTPPRTSPTGGEVIDIEAREVSAEALPNESRSR